jgi:Putative capsular polysaccharide synthesis protein
MDPTARADDYDAAKRAYLAVLDRDVKRVDVVFAAGKTGTTAIATALQRAGLIHVFQIHNLGSRASEAREREYRLRAPETRPVHIWQALWLASHPPDVGRRWKVVTSVRDPVARLVAQWFQEHARFDNRPISADDVVDQLFALWKRLDHDWFEFQYGAMLGIDVYEHPFDPAVGFGVIENPAIDALLLRQESLDRSAAPLREFFELSGPVDLRPANVGADKDYASLYGDVLDRVRLPDALLDSVYSTRFVRHFYSDTEIDAFRRHWTRAEAN